MKKIYRAGLSARRAGTEYPELAQGKCLSVNPLPGDCVHGAEGLSVVSSEMATTPPRIASVASAVVAPRVLGAAAPPRSGPVFVSPSNPVRPHVLLFSGLY